MIRTLQPASEFTPLETAIGSSCVVTDGMSINAFIINIQIIFCKMTSLAFNISKCLHK